MRSGRYQVRYTAPTGARLTAGCTFTARIDAEAWIIDKRREIERGRWRDSTPAPPVTFAEYAGTWLDNRHVSGRPIKPRTQEHYARILEAHLLPTLATKALAGIAPKDVRDWHAATLTDKPTIRSHAYSLLRTTPHPTAVASSPPSLHRERCQDVARFINVRRRGQHGVLGDTRRCDSRSQPGEAPRRSRH